MKFHRRLRWALPLILVLHALLSWRLLLLWWSGPVLFVEMSSTNASLAQVYFDRGKGLNEADSSMVPVVSSPGRQQLRLPLPHGLIYALRFDPLSSPGEVVIYRIEVLRPDGSVAASFSPAQIHEIQQIDQREVLPNGLRLHVSPPNIDPQLRLDLLTALDLHSRFPGFATLLKVFAANVALLFAECLIFFLRFIKPTRKLAAVVVVHALLSVFLLHLWATPPMVEVEMSSSVISRAQVYWDMGAGMSEVQSSSQPVYAGANTQLLQFSLPNGILKSLRFDPLTSSGTVVIRRAAVLRSDGSTALPIDPGRIRGVIGFDRMELGPDGQLFHIRTDSLDPQLAIDLDSPIDLTSSYPRPSAIGKTLLWNSVLLLLEALLFFWPPGLARTQKAFSSLNAAADALAGRLSNKRFIVFDRLSIWFYAITAGLFFLFALADLNGSSIGTFWTNYKVGAPARLIAGIPQEIRADEFNYQTPGMLNQYFRLHPFEVAQAPPGGHSVALLAELPVRHFTTWFRPQFWPFFALPANYAFAAWWQAKGLIMITGVFTLLLLILRSSPIAIAGTLWLFFSQFTQWCYSWPSMLPEMAGLFCFALVCVLYIAVGANRIALALCALFGAACAVNFALCAYVPHQIPYAWLGVFLAIAWCIGYRADIVRREGLVWRAAALVICLAITGVFMYTILADTKTAVAGIAATTYPGRRVFTGGGYTLTTFATHFLAGAEDAKRFPPEYSNINESAGFLWLAPVTLLCLARMRALSRDRQIVLGALWFTALLFLSWMIFVSFPTSLGHLLFFDRVQGVRFIPALGLINVCIVMLVLGAPHQPRRFGFDAKLTMTAPAVFVILYLANQNVHGYFHISELLWGALWATMLIVLFLDDRRLSFAMVLVIPNLLLFGLINPVERGIRTITATPLFDLVQRNSSLRQGKWLVFSQGFPPAIFTAVGCDVYNGMRYLPDLDHFPLLASHGVDTAIMNNLGYVNVEELKPGEPPRATRGPYGPILSISPLDPLVKELGIRYLAFHERPSQEVLDHLKPVIDGTASEYWLYELE